MCVNTVSAVEKNRNRYLDFVKGILILFVLWGHCIQYGTVGEGQFFENPLFKFIYSFHMPLFMLISGYLFYYSAKKRSLKELVFSRAYSFGIPLFVWGCLPRLLSYIIAFANKKQQINLLSILKAVYHIFMGFTSIWFLWSVLVISVIMAFAEKSKTRDKSTQAIIILFGVIFILLLPGSENNLFMYPYFILGYYLHSSNFLKWKKVLWMRVICIALFAIMLCFYSKECYIYTTGLWITNPNVFNVRQLGIDMFRYVIGVVGAISMLILSEKVCNSGVLSKRIKEYIVKIGMISLQIYILQRYIVESIGKRVVLYLVEQKGIDQFCDNMVIFNCFVTPIATVFLVIVIEKIVVFIEKLKISFLLFGRK